ncbi:MAG TPA: Ig-like domain-containing protein [Chitinophagaceae bacterium]|nr:Ig-like domain-containing protein [Chitinophagaceae bacterium]
MNGSVFTLFLAFVFIVFITATIGAGCANPIAPSGGPKDTLAPVMVDADPLDSTLNFNSKKIVFAFDEYVVLDNPHGNLVVSPVPKTDPVAESKLRTVTVKIKDTLEPNTTYSYDFGNAIKDNNEGNIIKNFTYVFSTGKYIDSLELRGHVINAQTGQSDSTLIVMLHRSGADSALIKEKPRYITKLNNQGNFHFKYLAPGVYYLYALKDESGQKKYLSKAQLLAFSGKPITIGQNNPADTLYAYLEKDDEKAKTSSATKPATIKADKDKEKDKRLKFTLNLDNGQQDLLGNLEFTFTEPLKNFDSSKAQFTDENFKPLTKYTFAKDTSNKKLTLTYKWTESTAFNLIVDKDFAEDSSGKKIARTDTLKFKTKREIDYGNLSIRFNNIDLSKKPVLQLIQSDAIKFSSKLTSRDFHDKLFRPGDYDIRILYDSNDNGIWDTGEFFQKHRQPEKVIAIPKKLSVKAGWDNDVTVEL